MRIYDDDDARGIGHYSDAHCDDDGDNIDDDDDGDDGEDGDDGDDDGHNDIKLNHRALAHFHAYSTIIQVSHFLILICPRISS